MYGLRGVINRCGVIAGPWQFGKVDQGVFTLWMLAHYFKKDNLKYIGFGGEGKQVRDLLHIEDLFNLVDFELKNMDKVNGRIYNVGGGKDISLSLLETTKICQEITGNIISIGKESGTRPADITIYPYILVIIGGLLQKQAGHQLTQQKRFWKIFISG